jgi:3-dehydroquinate dehydratase-2
MSQLLLVHGVNLNRLGQRAIEHYGQLTLADIEQLTRDRAHCYGVDVRAYQSNHEGDLVDELQAQASHSLGIIINAGAFTHYSYALHDAIVDTDLPTIEVHLSNIAEREPWRRTSVIAPACLRVIMGKKQQGYLEAVDALMEHLGKPRQMGVAPSLDKD